MPGDPRTHNPFNLAALAVNGWAWLAGLAAGPSLLYRLTLAVYTSTL